MEFKVITKDGQDYLVATLMLAKDGTLSSTCKTENYASTHGNISTGIMRNGKPLMYGANAFTSIPKNERQPNPLAK